MSTKNLNIFYALIGVTVSLALFAGLLVQTASASPRSGPNAPTLVLTINGGPSANIVDGEEVDIEWYLDGNIRNCTLRRNGSVIRKLYGYSHIPQCYADSFTELNSGPLYRYVNFHRPCYFPSTTTDKKGKQIKVYRYKDMMTPYEKFRSLPRASQYLKSGVTFKKLDAFACEMTDNEAVEKLHSARDILFKQLHERLKARA